jgi:hypothetical protein
VFGSLSGNAKRTWYIMSRNNAQYGEGHKPHHVWCNFANRTGPCKLCDEFYEKYPYETEEEKENLVAKHFPNARELNKE